MCVARTKCASTRAAVLILKVSAHVEPSEQTFGAAVFSVFTRLNLKEVQLDTSSCLMLSCSDLDPALMPLCSGAASPTLSHAPRPPHRSLPSQPLPDHGQGRVEGELAPVGAAVSQQQGARLGVVARRQQLGGGLLNIPASLLLVGQHVGAEQGVQGCGDAAHQEPGVQEQGEELGVAGGSHLLCGKGKKKGGGEGREKV